MVFISILNYDRDRARQFPSSVATRPPADPLAPARARRRPSPPPTSCQASPPADARHRPSPLCTDVSPDLASARACSWRSSCPRPDPAVRSHSPPRRPQVDRSFDPELLRWSCTCRIVSTGPSSWLPAAALDLDECLVISRRKDLGSFLLPTNILDRDGREATSAPNIYQLPSDYSLVAGGDIWHLHR